MQKKSPSDRSLTPPPSDCNRPLRVLDASGVCILKVDGKLEESEVPVQRTYMKRVLGEHNNWHHDTGSKYHDSDEPLINNFMLQTV